MSQDDWFNLIFPIVLVIFLVLLVIGYFQEKHYKQEIEDEHIKLEQEKYDLQQEIEDFNKEE